MRAEADASARFNFKLNQELGRRLPPSRLKANSPPDGLFGDSDRLEGTIGFPDSHRRSGSYSKAARQEPPPYQALRFGPLVILG